MNIIFRLVYNQFACECDSFDFWENGAATVPLKAKTKNWIFTLLNVTGTSHINKKINVTVRQNANVSICCVYTGLTMLQSSIKFECLIITVGYGLTMD